MGREANVSFRADITDLRKELKKIPGVTDVEAKRMVTKLTRQLKKAEKESTKAWKAARKKGPKRYGQSVAGLKGIFTAVIGGVAIQQVGRLISKFADLNDQINQTAKEAREVGESAEDYQRIVGAIDLLTRGGAKGSEVVSKLRKNLIDAADGSASMTRALDKMGLAVEDFTGLNAEDQLALMAEGLDGVTDESEKSQIALTLLGRAGGKLLPAFEGGAGALKNAADEIERAGPISNEAAAEAEKLADAGHLLGLEWRGLASDLLTEVSPALQDATDDIRDMIHAARESGAIEDLGAAISGLVNEDTIKLLGDATSATVEATKATNDLLDLWNIGTTLSLGIWLDGLYSWIDGGERYQRTIDNLEDSIFRLMAGTEAAGAEQRAMRDDFDDSAASARGYNQVLDEQLDRLVALGLVDPAKPEQEDKPKRPGTSPGDGLEKKLEKVRATLREHHGEVRNMDWSYRSQADEQWQRTQDLQLKGIQDLEAEKERAHKDQLERDREEAESAHQMYLSMLDHSQTYANTIGTIQGAITRMIVDGTEEGTEARRKAEQDAFIASKIAASANIVVSTAAAVAKANEITPPGNIPAMIAAAGVGVAQLAVVAAEQPTFHTGGEVQATLEAGEHVSSRQAVRNAGGHEALDQLERGNGPMAGGRFTVIQQVNNRTTFAAEYEAIRTGASPYSAELAAMQPERRGLRNPYAEA